MSCKVSMMNNGGGMMGLGAAAVTGGGGGGVNNNTTTTTVTMGLSVDSQWTKANSLDNGIKLAGEEAKDRLYEPKHKKKLVRVLTVVAYVFFVSLAAIMLSLYYVFLWGGDQKLPHKYVVLQQRVRCDPVVAEMQQQMTALPDDKEFTAPTVAPPSSTATPIDETTTLWPDYSDLSSEFEGRSTFIKKLMYNKYPYAEND